MSLFFLSNPPSLNISSSPHALLPGFFHTLNHLTPGPASVLFNGSHTQTLTLCSCPPSCIFHAVNSSPGRPAQQRARAPFDGIDGAELPAVSSSLTGCSGWSTAELSLFFSPSLSLSFFLTIRVMSFGTSTKTGFSVRDILDLPNPAGKCGSGTEETEEDETEEASVEVSSSENAPVLGFNGCGGSFSRWSRGSGNLHFSCEGNSF